MRTIEFIVNAQVIEKDPNCDFSDIIPGSRNYLSAHFTFSEEWEGCRVAASFWRGDKEYPVRLDSNGSCIIPSDALTGSTFKVSLTGLRGAYLITTNKAIIRQGKTIR